MPEPPTATILVAEPDAVDASVVRHALAREGYQVLWAGDSEEALRIARFDLPGLILLDTALPGEESFATCRRLKTDPQTRDIPVVFLSTEGTAESQALGFELGAVDYITRPFHTTELLARTRLFLQLKHKGEAALARQSARLEQVRSAQLALMPRPHEVPQGRFGIGFIPVLEAGGDFYDVFAIDADITAYCVADVSGHDLAASFASPVIKAALRTHARSGDQPRDTLQAINRSLRTVLRDGQHVTACLAFVDRGRRRLTVANAAHPAPFLLAPDGAAIPLPGGGDVLGVFETVEFDQVEQEFTQGERLFLFTDGVTEPLGGATRDRAAGLRRLTEVCRGVAGLPVAVAVPEVLVQAFVDDPEMDDDFVLLGVEL